jgi:ABC-2 type transport system permease protein
VVVLGFRPHGGATGLALGVVLVVVFASTLSWVFCRLGLVLRSPSAVSNLALLVLFPLTMAGNTFVDPDTMPHWARAVLTTVPSSMLNPANRLVTPLR